MILLFCRGFSQVVFVSLNVVCLQRGLWGWSFVSSWLLSAVWYLNVGRASDDRRVLSLAMYATGAAAGTLCGAALGRWL